MKRITALFAAVVLLVSLSSCRPLLRSSSDVANFIGEPVIAEPGCDCEAAAYAARIIRLISSENPEIPVFDNPRTAANVLRDRILSGMLNGNYTKYSGYTTLLAEAEKKYPKLRVSVIIPEKDFEYTVYTNFGGAKSVRHGSGAAFTYLSRIGAYTTVAQPPVFDCEVNITSAYETENTYVMTFYTQYGLLCSSLYSGIFVKRADGTIYLGKLEKIADPKVVVPGAESAGE